MERAYQLLKLLTLKDAASVPTEEINQIVHSDDGFTIFYELSLRTQEDDIRKSCYLFLYKILSNNQKNITFLRQAKEPIINLINSEKIGLLFNNVVECLAIIAEGLSCDNEWVSDAAEIGMKLVNTKERTNQGLYFHIIMYEYYSEEQKEELNDILIDLVIRILTSDDIGLYINAMDLLNTISFEVFVDEPDTIVHRIPGLTDVILRIFYICCNNNNSTMLTTFIDLVASFFFDRYTCFMTFSVSFLSEVLNALDSEKIAPDFKLQLTTIIDNAAESFPEIFRDCGMLQACTEKLVNLSIIFAEQDSEYTDFFSLFKFFDCIACSLDDESIYTYLYNICRGLCDDGTSTKIKVGIQLLSSIVEGYKDYLVEDPNTYYQFIKTGFGTNDELVIESVLDLIDSLIEADSASLNDIFDPLIQLLIPRVFEFRFACSLEKLLFLGSKSYSDPPSLINALIEAFNDGQCHVKAELINCITACLLKQETIEEKLFELLYKYIYPYLSDFSSTKMNSACFGCIAAMVKLSPISAGFQSEELIKLIVQLVTVDNLNVIACLNATDALVSLFSVLSLSVCRSLDKLYQGLVRIANIDPPGISNNTDHMEQIDYTDYDVLSARSNAILCLGRMCEGALGDVVLPIADIIKELQLKLHSCYVPDNTAAACALRRSVSICFRNNLLDRVTLLKDVLSIAMECKEEDFLAELLHLLSTIYSLSEPKLAITYSNDIYNLLIKIITENHPLFLSKVSLRVMKNLIPPLFEALEKLILLLGRNSSSDFFQSTVNAMMTFLNGRSTVLKGHSIKILSTILMYFSDIGVSPQALMEFALQGVQQNVVAFKVSSFNGISTLVRAQTDACYAYIETILPLCTSVFGSGDVTSDLYNSALCSWCTVNLIYQLNITSDMVIKAFEKLRFNSKKTSDQIVVFSRFIFYASKHVSGIDNIIQLTGAIIMSSSDFEIARISAPTTEIRDFYIDIMIKCVDILPQLTMMNQRKSSMIAQRLR